MDAYEYIEGAIKMAKEHIANEDYTTGDLIEAKANLLNMVANYEYLIDDEDVERLNRRIKRLRLRRASKNEGI